MSAAELVHSSAALNQMSGALRSMRGALVGTATDLDASLAVVLAGWSKDSVSRQAQMQRWEQLRAQTERLSAALGAISEAVDAINLEAGECEDHTVALVVEGRVAW